MNRSKARWRKWGLAVMWDAEADEPQAVTAAATVVHVVHHYPPVGGIGPHPRVIQAIVQDAITTGDEEQSCA